MKDSGVKIQDHIEAFNNLMVDLQNLGEDLTDERKALHLLSSLPMSYQSMSRVLLHRDRKTITYDEVVSALLTDDLQQKLVLSSEPASLSDAALYVNRGRPLQRTTEGDGRSKYRSPASGHFLRKPHYNDRRRKTMTCWACGKQGHMQQDCHQEQIDVSSANVALAEYEDDEEDLLDDFAL